MSVLIKMEMPKDERHHKALLIFEPDGTGKCIVEYSESYSDRHIKTFEAIEIPTPHGRLIDASVLWRLLYDYVDSIGMPDMMHFDKIMEKAFSNTPTIIPAEESET